MKNCLFLLALALAVSTMIQGKKMRLEQGNRIDINFNLVVFWLLKHYDTIFNLISGPPTQPTAPLEIVALGPHSIMVEWGAPESDGGAPLEGYKVAVRDAKRHMWMEVGRVAADVQKLKVQELAVSIFF